MPCYSPLKGFRNKENGGIVFKRSSIAGEEMEVSCGQCLGCRLDRSRMWAMRCVHEASLHEMDGGNCFITLTYDDEHLPESWSLDKSHYQKFMKRLRKHFAPQKIKFFMCGEYGDKCQHIPIYSSLTVEACDQCSVGRPHYHAILFNCSFHDLVVVGSKDGQDVYSSPTLEAIWGMGLTQVGECNFQSCAYVARYVTKKVTGLLAPEHYMWIDDYGVCHFIEPEYNSMSRGARQGARGIGAEWFDKYKDDVFPSDEVPVPGEGVLKGTPRYYTERLRELDEQAYDRVKESRLSFRRDHAEDYTPERLMAKYKVKEAQFKLLKRTLG